MTLQNTTNRIREHRLRRSWSMQQLADAAGTTRGQIDKLERGSRRLTVDWMIRLARALECDPRALLTVDHQVPPTTAPPTADAAIDLLPVYALQPAKKTPSPRRSETPIDWVPRPYFLSHTPDAYALYAVGSAMEPMYRAGQILFIHPHRPPQQDGGVVAYLHDGTVLIRTYQGAHDHALVLRHYQPRQRDSAIAPSDVQALHTIVGVANG